MYKVSVNDKNYELELAHGDLNKGSIDGEDFQLDVLETKPNSYHILKDNKSYVVDILTVNQETKEFQIKVNGVKYELKIQDELDVLLKSLGLHQVSTKVNDVKAPMPGLVLDVLTEVGSEVQKGDTLLVLEAMKMENNIKSPTAGVVKELHCKKGDAVEKNQLMLVFA